MSKKGKNISCISCSIFKQIIDSDDELRSSFDDISYISSVYHMYPAKLESLMQRKLEKTKNDNVVLLYGDCHPGMIDMEDNPNISRLSGINCIDIFLDKQSYRKLRKEGAFVLLYEWAIQWEGIFKKELGLEGELAKEFFNDMHSKIVYIDTGKLPVPNDKLKEIQEFTSLPVEIIKSDSDVMIKNLKHQLKDINSNK